MSMEERLSAQEARMVEVLRLLRERTSQRRQSTYVAREPMIVTIPAESIICYPMVPQTPVHGIVGEATTETATTVVAPLETSTLTPPPTTMNQVIATPTTETPSTFVLAPEAKLLREFLKFKPDFFHGGGDPEVAGRWILSHQRFHKLMRNDEAVQARLSGACLRGSAAVWWTTYTDTHPEPTTWAEFRELFYDQFIPMEVSRGPREEFLSLKQGSRTLLQYMERYRILLQFALDVAGTERLQIYYFTRGVDDRIASAIVSSGATTLA
ncbi:hypothetical protein Syun_027132 [Stephania yunnanensis]|uniref:Retrotransposon gag domain-containing protein n=1 Tax=Stephania yunnanensis TaxID=152371 RepID=A0AAP0HPX9_9MAGN